MKTVWDLERRWVWTWGWIWSVCFNITIVSCFPPSLCLKTFKMEMVLATSLLSGRWGRSTGHTPSPPYRPSPVTCTETRASRPFLHLASKWVLTTPKARDRSAPLPLCSRLRMVRLSIALWAVHKSLPFQSFSVFNGFFFSLCIYSSIVRCIKHSKNRLELIPLPPALYYVQHWKNTAHFITNGQKSRIL